MENIESLTTDVIISAYKNAGYEMTEKYQSLSIYQLKFRKGFTYVDIDWKTGSDCNFPLKSGNIFIFIVNDNMFTSKEHFGTAYTISKEELFKASTTIDSPEKMSMYLHNAMTEKLLETL